MRVLKIHLEEQLLIVLNDKTFNIVTNPSYDEYQCTLASVVYKFVDKKSSGSSIKKEIMSN